MTRLSGLTRFWPQKVRTRLTVIYTGLFLSGGIVLLGMTYLLVAKNLPVTPPAGKPPMTMNEFTKFCKHPQVVKSHALKRTANSRPPTSVRSPKLRACAAESAYLAGSKLAALNQRRRALNDMLLFSGLGLAAMTVVSAGAGWVVAGRVLRPVRVITGTARRASEQHLGERIALSGARDELKELADTFDDMLERLDRAFSAQRRFVADASHELRTPLTLMRTAIDVTLAKPGRTAAQLESMAVRVRRSIDRAESMIDALLTLAISDQGRQARAEPVNLATVAEDAVEAVAAQIERLDLRVKSDLEPAETSGDPHLLERMVSNLVDNAVRHNTQGGEVSLESGTRDSRAFLHVANSGPRIPDELVPSLFEPFRRMEGRTGSGAGAGLGLAIARSVAAAHGAALEASARPAGGLDVRVDLPARPQTGRATAADPAFRAATTPR
jgi:signal transduction histidine kinase